MEERKYNGNVEFSELFDEEFLDSLPKKRFNPSEKIMEAIDNPENKTIIIHKEGSRTIFGGVVYEFRNGKKIKVGLSWQNTEETIWEHEDKG